MSIQTRVVEVSGGPGAELTKFLVYEPGPGIVLVDRYSVQQWAGKDFSRAYLKKYPQSHRMVALPKACGLGIIEGGRPCMFITPEVAVDVLQAATGKGAAAQFRYGHGIISETHRAALIAELETLQGPAPRSEKLADEKLRKHIEPPGSPADLDDATKAAVEGAECIVMNTDDGCVAECQAGQVIGRCALLFRGTSVTTVVVEAQGKVRPFRRAYAMFNDLCMGIGFLPDVALDLIASVKSTKNEIPSLDLIQVRTKTERLVASDMFLAVDSIYSWLSTYPWSKYNSDTRSNADVWQSGFKEAVLKHMAIMLGHAPAAEKSVLEQNLDRLTADTPKAESPKFDKKKFLDEVKGIPHEPKAEKVPSKPAEKQSKAEKVPSAQEVFADPSDSMKSPVEPEFVFTAPAEVVVSSDHVKPFRFDGDNLILVEKDRQWYVSVTAICLALGIDSKNQREKLNGDPQYDSGLITSTDAGGAKRELFCLNIDDVEVWLLSINSNKVRPDVAPKLLAYQKELKTALNNYTRKGIAINPRLVPPETDIDKLTALVKAQIEYGMIQNEKIDRLFGTNAKLLEDKQAIQSDFAFAVNKAETVVEELATQVSKADAERHQAEEARREAEAAAIEAIAAEARAALQARQATQNYVELVADTADIKDKAVNYDEYLSSDLFFSSTNMAQKLGLTANAFDEFLWRNGVLKRVQAPAGSEFHWTLTAKYVGEMLGDVRPMKIEHPHTGRRATYKKHWMWRASKEARILELYRALAAEDQSAEAIMEVAVSTDQTFDNPWGNKPTPQDPFKKTGVKEVAVASKIGPHNPCACAQEPSFETLAPLANPNREPRHEAAHVSRPGCRCAPGQKMPAVPKATDNGPDLFDTASGGIVS